MKINYYLGLGSNIEPRLNYIQQAVSQLEQLGRIEKRSAIYQTQAWGRTDQDDFFNAVIRFSSALDGTELLSGIKKIETALNRQPGEKWGPRTIDIDILWSDGPEIKQPDLQVPHPLLSQRLFVLKPLSDVTDSLQIEENTLDLSGLLDKCTDKSKVVKLNLFW